MTPSGRPRFRSRRGPETLLGVLLLGVVASLIAAAIWAALDNPDDGPSTPPGGATNTAMAQTTSQGTTVVPSPVPAPVVPVDLERALPIADEVKRFAGGRLSQRAGAAKLIPVKPSVGTPVCDGATVQSELFFDSRIRAFEYGPLNPELLAVEVAQFRSEAAAAQYVREMRDAAVAKCGYRDRTTGIEGVPQSIQLVRDGSPQTGVILRQGELSVDRNLLRKGAIVLQIAVQTDDSEQSAAVDQLARRLATRLPSG